MPQRQCAAVWKRGGDTAANGAARAQQRRTSRRSMVTFFWCFSELRSRYRMHSSRKLRRMLSSTLYPVEVVNSAVMVVTIVVIVSSSHVSHTEERRRYGSTNDSDRRRELRT